MRNTSLDDEFGTKPTTVAVDASLDVEFGDEDIMWQSDELDRLIPEKGQKGSSTRQVQLFIDGTLQITNPSTGAITGGSATALNDGNWPWPVGRMRGETGEEDFAVKRPEINPGEDGEGFSKESTKYLGLVITECEVIRESRPNTFPASPSSPAFRDLSVHVHFKRLPFEESGWSSMAFLAKIGFGLSNRLKSK